MSPLSVSTTLHTFEIEWRALPVGLVIAWCRRTKFLLKIIVF